LTRPEDLLAHLRTSAGNEPNSASLTVKADPGLLTSSLSAPGFKDLAD